MRPLPTAALALLFLIGCEPRAGTIQTAEPRVAPTPSRPTASPIVGSDSELTAEPATSIDRVDPPVDEPAPSPARGEGRLSEFVCESDGYGKSVHAVWRAAHDDLLTCGELQSGTNFILNVSIFHGKPRYGGGPLPGHAVAIGVGGDEGIADTAVQCLAELGARLETQFSPVELPARADCRASFDRG